MNRLPFTLTLAWVSLVLPGASLLCAQSSHSTPPRAITLFVGGSAASQLDATASPRVFDGLGANARLEYGHPLDGGRYRVDASAGGGWRRASPSGATDAASERTIDAELRGTLLRQWSRPSNGSTLGLGVAGAATLGLTQHQYADPTARSSDFSMSAVTLGPAVAWSLGVRGGIAGLQLSSPVIGMVNHPYSDVRNGASLGSMRLASLGTLRGANAQLSYATSLNRLFGITYSYRFGVLDYADVQPFRSISHQLSVGVSRRLAHQGDDR